MALLLGVAVLGPWALAQPDDAPPSTAGVVAEVGSDPAALTAWVAEHVALDAYAGAMRGAEGALRAGAASPADMALLLHDLLELADPAGERRFASCTLAAGTVERASLDLRPPPPVPKPWLSRLELLLPEVGDDTELRTIVTGLASVWHDLEALGHDHGGRLVDALAGRHPGAVPAAGAPDVSLARHVWLQDFAEGAWHDLDPTLGTGAGCAPTWVGPALPADLVGRLTIDVEVETFAGARTTLLRSGWPLTELVEAPPAVAIAEAFGDDLVGPREPTSDDLLRYTPVVFVGDVATVGEPFWLPTPATLELPPPDGFGGLGDAIGDAIDGGLGGAFGGALGDAGDDPLDGPEATVPAAPGGPEAAALWLVVTVTMPDGWEQRVERAIFDRVGMAARPDGTAELSALTEVEGEYRALATVRSIAVWHGAWTYGPTANEADDVAPTEDLVALVRALHALHGPFEVLRHALYASIAAPDAPRFVQRRPGVSVLAWRPEASDEATADGSFVMDVLIDPVEVAPPAPGVTAVDATAAAAAWAVSAVVAERLLVGVERLLLPHFGEPVKDGHAVDVLAVFDAAEAAGIGVTWIDPDDRRIPAGASPEAIARIDAQLAAGRSVLAPDRPVDIAGHDVLGWWALDPRTGVIRDQMEAGGHQAGEYTVTTQPSRTAAPALRRTLGRRICNAIVAAAIVMDLGAVLQGAPGAGHVARGLMTGLWRVEQVIEKYRQAGGSVRGSCGGAAGAP